MKSAPEASVEERWVRRESVGQPEGRMGAWRVRDWKETRWGVSHEGDCGVRMGSRIEALVEEQRSGAA